MESYRQKKPPFNDANMPGLAEFYELHTELTQPLSPGEVVVASPWIKIRAEGGGATSVEEHILCDGGI
ncbi:hypothetical protein U1Q18_035802 [Sarracenia purpurea var. burkii]